MGRFSWKGTRGRCATLAAWLLIGGVASAASPPNVVLIISDDHAWTDYSFMGHPNVRTPRIDKLASQSLTFRRGYVPSSLCSPSLATIITGLYPHQHRVTSNDPPLSPDPTGRKGKQDATFLALREQVIDNFERVPTLPRLLAAAGYGSFQTGKWWGGSYQRGGFSAGMSQGGRHGDAGLKIGREGMTPIFDFIDAAAGEQKPFFVWYAPMMPHSPHTPPDRLLAKYKDKAPTESIAKYWAMIDWFDETCGQLLDRLDQKGIADNTLVIYIADNGWIQDPAADRYAPRSKQSQYDGGLRTPILLRWPAKIRPRESEHLALSIDLAPTILAAAGLKPTSQMQGINLLDESAVSARKAIFGEIFSHNAVDINKPATSLRFRWGIEGDWKLILPDVRNEPDGSVELYNLAADPHESRNLADKEPKRVEQLKALINGWWAAEG